MPRNILAAKELPPAENNPAACRVIKSIRRLDGQSIVALALEIIDAIKQHFFLDPNKSANDASESKRRIGRKNDPLAALGIYVTAGTVSPDGSLLGVYTLHRPKRSRPISARDQKIIELRHEHSGKKRRSFGKIGQHPDVVKLYKGKKMDEDHVRRAYDRAMERTGIQW